MKESIRGLKELLAQERQRAGEATAKVSHLEASNARLMRGATSASHEASTHREHHAHKELQLTLMADRRDELLETIERLQADAAEHAQSLGAIQRARQDADVLVQEEQQRRAAAERASDDAISSSKDAWATARQWQLQSEADREELERQRQHCSALLTQDSLREREQEKLFNAVSEVLARIQYLGEIPPHQMGMSKAEALQHREEAVRHLKFLREAHALSTNPPKLVLNRATLQTGAALLETATKLDASPRRVAAVTTKRGGAQLDATVTVKASPRRRVPDVVHVPDVPAADPARRGLKGDEPASEWERRKLLGLMAD